MRKYLLPQNGNFYKANLHSHTNLSDGNLSPEEAKKHYKDNGYSVLAYTDHNKFIAHSDLTDDTFLALNGVEININTSDYGKKYGKTCHFCMISLTDTPIEDIFEGTERVYNPECITAMMQKARDNGYFVTYNHPTWSMEGYSDYTNYHGMHAMEIYNNECYLLGHDEHNNKQYDDMLKNGEKIFCIATDDNHNKAELGSEIGGFTMIKAEDLSYNNITQALLKGDFYASEGPLIDELYIEDKKLYIKCSPAAEIRFNTPYRIASIKKKVRYPVTEAVFKLRGDEGWFRLTITDENGKNAYTHAYFTDKIFGEEEK
ncbi:MAG: CehA/McbA family metallohydrolase [Clostridia bacterium]|nr:CehA/McbA family metallohydrolase [Clostridia bacterium]